MSAKVWRNAEGKTLDELKAPGAQREAAAPERPDGLTGAEGRVMDLLTDAALGFLSLPAHHPQEQADFVDAVRRGQAMLAVRACRRAHPDGWPIR